MSHNSTTRIMEKRQTLCPIPVPIPMYPARPESIGCEEEDTNQNLNVSWNLR